MYGDIFLNTLGSFFKFACLKYIVK